MNYDPERRAASLRVSARITDDWSVLVHASDPQSWHRFSPFFAETTRVDGAGYAPLPATPVGRSWDGYLYERFVGPLLSFENVLAIDTSVSADDVRVDYSLHDSLSWTLCGVKRAGIIEVDRGAIHAVRSGPDAFDVTVDKTLVFSDRDMWARWLGVMAPALLRGWIELHAWIPSRGFV